MKPRTETKARTRTRTNLGTWQLVVVLSLMIVTWGCSGGGGGGGGAGAGAQNAPTLTFTGNSDGTISVIEVAADGKMTQHGFVDVGPFSVDALEVHPNGRFLFALSNDVLHVFTIDEKTLQFVDTLGIGGAAVELVISNSGRFGYIGRGGAQPAVITFSIDQSSGEVDNIDTLTTGDIPSVMVLDTPSNFLFALVGGQIQSFKLSNAGLPTLSAIRTPLDPPVGLTLSSGGDDLFVTTEFDDVYSYAVEADGSLVQNSVATNLGNAYSNLRHPILSADGDYLYALNLSQSTVVTLSVDESGAILGTVGNPQSTRGRGSAARLSADGSQLYVGNDASAVTVLELSGGAPSFSGEQMRVRSDVSSLAVRVGQGNAPRAPMLYVPNASDGTILAFRVENDGELNERAATPTGDGPRQVAFHPNGRFAYGLSHDSADVETFSVNTVTGALTSLDVVSLASVDPEQDLIRVTVDPTGRFLFVLDGRVNLGNTGIIHMLQIDSDGIPGGAVFNTPSGGFNPEAFVIAPNGRFLYVANSYGDRITVFELDRDFGILTQKYSYTGYDRPTNMVLHPDGFSLYVVLENEESVARFRVEENGALSSLSEYQTATPEDTLEIALHPNRDRLYLTSYDGTIATFQVTAVGTLTYQGQVDIGLTHALAITPDGMNLYGTTSQMIREFSLDATSGMPTLDGVLDVPGQAAHARPTLR